MLGPLRYVSGAAWPALLARALTPALLAGLLVLGAGCRASGSDEAPPPDGPEDAAEALAAPEPVFALPENWATTGLFGFERWVADVLPEGRTPVPLGEADLGTLATALRGQDETAVRAAVVLVRSGDARAAAQLAALLAERAQGPARDSDAAAVVAAAGLGLIEAGRAHAGLLAELALGPVPHPDLEVRVECAAAALAWGRVAVAPFLLRVLREATPAAAADPADWPLQTTLAWSKSRGAHALALRSRTALTFAPDASVADQMAAADELEVALAADAARRAASEPD